MAEQCCKSCPLQATPIVFPPTFAPNDLTVGLDMDSYSVTMGEDLQVCCVASSVTNPTMEAFLDLVIPCFFSAESKIYCAHTHSIRNILTQQIVAIPGCLYA